MVAILNLVLAVLPSQPAYYQVPSEILAKVYSNSMMVLLNSRMRIGVESSFHDRMHDHQFPTEPITSMDTNAIELGEGMTIAQVAAESEREDKQNGNSQDTGPPVV